MTLALYLPLLVQGAATQPVEAVRPDEAVIVTATLLPPEPNPIASASLLPRRTVDALSPPLVSELFRLSPGIAVATSGAPGQQTQVRIRGAEANHTLLFVDGIQLNDVSAGNEARFEILPTDGVGRIEFVRGPQSALHGSEALGGVIALSTPVEDRTLGDGLFELGSRNGRRAAARASVPGVTVGGSFQASRGVDILGGGAGDRDGYENRTAYLAARGTVAGGLNAQLAARYIDHDAEFDGSDPLTFRRADTLDATRTRTGAVRGALAFGQTRGLAGGFDAQYLRSSARNRRGATALNRTAGDRLRLGADARYVPAIPSLGADRIAAIARVEHEEENFTARGDGTDQDRSRARTAVVGEVRATFGPVIADVAVRHDAFNRFQDATTLRAGALVRLADGIHVAGSYGQGIAQPTFFDLFGFFPGSFRGNPGLRPERSRGFELSLRYEGPLAAASVTGFSDRLQGEIATVFDAQFVSSTVNRSGRSRRRGAEVAAEFRPTADMRVGANYTFLDAGDQQDAGEPRLREVRRPRHSGNLFADGTFGPVTLGAAASYVGRRRDTDFDSFDATTGDFTRVRLDDYLLLSARAEYRVADRIGLFVRGENLGDADYRDAVGYETAGLGVHAGVRLRIE